MTFKALAAWKSLFHLQPDALLTTVDFTLSTAAPAFFSCYNFAVFLSSKSCPGDSPLEKKLSDSFLSFLSLLQGEIFAPIVPILQL